ncbi:hypothetical protein D3C72_1466500 [compost metagenome]
MGLVVEEMHEQAEKLAPVRPLAVAVVEQVVQVFFADGGGPVDDELVQPLPVRVHGGKILGREQRVREGSGRRDGADGIEQGEAGRVLRIALQPQGVAHHHVVQGGQQGTKKGAPLALQLAGRQAGRRCIDLGIHPLVVIGHQVNVGATAHAGLLQWMNADVKRISGMRVCRPAAFQWPWPSGSSPSGARMPS